MDAVLTLLLNRANEAAVSGNKPLESLCIKKVLLVPTVCLLHYKGKSNDRNTIRTILDKILLDDWSTLTVSKLFNIDTNNPESPSAPRPKSSKSGKKTNPNTPAQLSPEQKIARTLVANGMISKGFAALTRSKVAPDTLANATILQDLHPSLSSEDGFSELDRIFSSPSNINFTPDDVRSHISRLGNLVAPGTDKFRFEHLRQLLGGANNEAGNKFCIALTPFLLRIARGTIPPDIAAFLSSGSLIALDKGDGKLRPIALGDALRKIAIGVAIQQSLAEIHSQLGNVQLGMSKSGCERIFHTINVFSALHPTHDAMFIDGKNAFNVMNRRKALTILKDRLPQFVGYFLAFYGSASSLWFGGKLIKAEVGVQQGDVFAPLIYALSTLPLLHKANSFAEDPSSAYTVGYFDDISSLGDTTNSKRTLELYKTEGPQYGFHVNPKKTIILLGAELTLNLASAKKAEYCDILGIPHDSPNVIIHPDNDPSTRPIYGVRLLGCPFGTPDFCELWLNEHYKNLCASCQLVIDIPDAQLQWCFYNYILTKKVNHLLRCVSPDSLVRYNDLVDTLLRKTFQHIIGVTVTDHIWRQVKTSVGVGGLGIVDIETTALSAHAASCLEVLPFLTSVLTLDSLMTTKWYHNMSDCVAAMNHIVTKVSDIEYTSTKSRKPALDPLFLQLDSLMSTDCPHKLQFKFSTFMSACRDFMFLRSICDDDDYNWCRIKSLSNPESGAILTASLNIDNTCTSEEFRVILCDRLGIPHPFISPTTRCTCKSAALIGVHGEHAHNCAMGGERYARHKIVCDHFCDLIALSGVAVAPEPSDCFSLDDSKKRPDFFAKNINRPGRLPTELFDVSIVNPGGKGYLKAGSANTPGVAAEHQLQLKSNTYSSLASSANYDFQGIIFESYGMFHEKAKDLINFCCTKIASRTGRPFAKQKKFWTTRISVAIVRGTARMILTKYFDVVSSTCIKNKECLNSLDQDSSVFASPFDLSADFGDDSSFGFASSSEVSNDGPMFNVDADDVSFGGVCDVDVDVDVDGADEVEMEA